MASIQSIFIALIFNGVDILTGLISAVKTEGIKSSKLRDGLFKKVGFLVCYFMAWLIDRYGILVGFNFTIHILPIIVSYSCITELVSIIENIHKINPKLLPHELLKLFQIDDKKGE